MEKTCSNCFREANHTEDYNPCAGCAERGRDNWEPEGFDAWRANEYNQTQEAALDGDDPE